MAWPARDGKILFTGRSLATGKPTFELPADGHEAQTWQALIDARLGDDGSDVCPQPGNDASAGVSVEQLGGRLAGTAALAAERSNVAARHIFGLRKRLADRDAITTLRGHYRLRAQLQVARVDRRA